MRSCTKARNEVHVVDFCAAAFTSEKLLRKFQDYSTARQRTCVACTFPNTSLEESSTSNLLYTSHVGGSSVSAELWPNIGVAPFHIAMSDSSRHPQALRHINMLSGPCTSVSVARNDTLLPGCLVINSVECAQGTWAAFTVQSSCAGGCTTRGLGCHSAR